MLEKCLKLSIFRSTQAYAHPSRIQSPSIRREGFDGNLKDDCLQHRAFSPPLISSVILGLIKNSVIHVAVVWTLWASVRLSL